MAYCDSHINMENVSVNKQAFAFRRDNMIAESNTQVGGGKCGI